MLVPVGHLRGSVGSGVRLVGDLRSMWAHVWWVWDTSGLVWRRCVACGWPEEHRGSVWCLWDISGAHLAAVWGLWVS